MPFRSQWTDPDDDTIIKTLQFFADWIRIAIVFVILIIGMVLYVALTDSRGR